ncbi:MAG: hypothetical protein ACJ78Q_20065 [Chloroflexia bacterium]
MRTEELLEQCLQALTSGQDLPPDLARYLARHPEQRSEVEDLLAIAQRVSRRPRGELHAVRRENMQVRLAARLGFDPRALDALLPGERPAETEEHSPRKKPILSVGRVSLAKLRYEPPYSSEDDIPEARIREVFRDLTAEDIRRYIGVRGEDYLYYRQNFPGWRPVFTFVAVVLRGIKRLEVLASQNY